MGEKPKQQRPKSEWEDSCVCGATFDIRNGAGLCRACAAEELPPEQVVRNLTDPRPVDRRRHRIER